MKIQCNKLLLLGVMVLGLVGFAAGCGSDGKKATETPPQTGTPVPYNPIAPSLRTSVTTGEIDFANGTAAIDKAKIQQLLVDNMPLATLGNTTFILLTNMLGQTPAFKTATFKPTALKTGSAVNPILGSAQFQNGLLPLLRSLGLPLPPAKRVHSPLFAKTQTGQCDSGTATYTLPDELDALVAQTQTQFTKEQAEALARQAFQVKFAFNSCDLTSAGAGVLNGGLDIGLKVSGDKASGITTLVNVTCNQFVASSGFSTGRPLTCNGMLIAQVVTTVSGSDLTYDMIINADKLSIKDGDDSYGVDGAVEAKFTGTVDPAGAQNLCNVFLPIAGFTAEEAASYCSSYSGYAGILGDFPYINNMNFVIVVDATYSDVSGSHKLLEGLDIKVTDNVQERYFAMYPGAAKANGYYSLGRQPDGSMSLQDDLAGLLAARLKGSDGMATIYGGYTPLTAEDQALPMMELLRKLLKTYAAIQWQDADSWIISMNP